PLGCVTTNQPTFSWAGVPGATAYWLVVNVGSPDFSGSPGWAINVNVSSTTYASPVAFQSGQTVYWKVKSLFGSVPGRWSSTGSFTPNCVPPPAPTGVTATGVVAAVSLSWSPVAGVLGYNVKRSLSSGGGYITIANTLTATSYTDSAANS